MGEGEVGEGGEEASTRPEDDPRGYTCACVRARGDEAGLFRSS